MHFSVRRYNPKTATMQSWSYEDIESALEAFNAQEERCSLLVWDDEVTMEMKKK